MPGQKPKREEEGQAIPSSQTGRAAHWRPWMTCPILALLTVVLYWPVGGFGFINYDDPAYFALNSHVLKGLSGPNLLWAFQTTAVASWYPFTWLSYLLDATLFGQGAAGPHITNLVLHVANTFLVFHLLKRLTGAHWRSAFVAALFAVHPLNVETVAWISERKGLLSAFFGLLSLGAYTRYASAQTNTTKARTAAYYGLALVFFVSSLLSKPALATLPVAMLLVDFWPLNRVASPLKLKAFLALVLEKIPFVVAGLLSSAVTILVHQQAGSLTSLTTVSATGRLAAVFVSYKNYLEKAIWPASLALPYPDPGSWPLLTVISAMALVVGVSLFAVRSARRRPYLFVGWFWFLVMLLPVIGIIGWGSHTMADRYAYVPMLGIFVIVTWLGAELFGRSGMLRACGVAIALMVLAAFAWRAEDQLHYWKDSETLFRHSLAVTKDNIVALDHLGIRLSYEGRSDEAIDCFNEALRLNPKGPQVLYDLGNALAGAGRFPEAITNFEAALELMPQHAEAHNNLALVLAGLGRFDEAIPQYQRALVLAPESIQTRKDLGDALAVRGKMDEAIVQYQLVLVEEPDNAETRYNLGYALRMRGRLDDAEQQLGEALRLQPEFPLAHYNLACVLRDKGETNAAVTHLKEALRLKPDYAEAKRALATLEKPGDK